MAGRGSKSRYGELALANAALACVQIAYGGAQVLLKVMLDANANEVVLGVYRAAAGAAVLALPALICERRRRRRPAIMAPVAAVVLASGVAGFACAPVLLYAGIAFSSATMGGLVCLVIAVATFGIAVAAGQEPVRWRARDGQAKILAVALSVAGVATVLTVDGPRLLDGGAGRRRVGIVFVILSGVFYGVYFTLQRPLLARWPAPVAVTALAHLAGGCVLAVAGGVVIRDPAAWMIFGERAVVVPLVCASLITSVSFAVQAWVVQTAGPVLVAFYSPLQTFAGGVLAHVFLGEIVVLGSVVGALLTCSALYLMTWALAKGRQREFGVAEPVLGTGSESLEEPLLR